MAGLSPKLTERRDRNNKMHRTKQSHCTSKDASGKHSRLQLIEGGKDKRKGPVSKTERMSLAARFLYHGAKPQVLAWESGLSQAEIFWLAADIIRTESFENGMKAERLRQRLMPPMGRAA